MQLVHGGDWAGFEEEYGRAPLDFSANVSPLGVPLEVQQAIARAAGEADRYPDPLCRKLRRAIGRVENVPPEWIYCGNGAAEVIWRLVAALRPQNALITAPTFAEYEAALSRAGCTVVHARLSPEKGFVLEESFLQEITARTEMVFLCEPNNPTGRTTPAGLLHRIVERCAAVGAVLVVDECFGAFLEDSPEHTLVPLLENYHNLFILKAFTKMYAMAGVRLGYGLCADQAVMEKLYKAGPPWSVSNLAQEAGCVALRQTEYVGKVRALIREQRNFLAQGLRSLGLQVIPGKANYLLFRCTTPLTLPLRKRGILLRSCSNYLGLDENWYRTAVRTETENRRLLAALEEILS